MKAILFCFCALSMLLSCSKDAPKVDFELTMENSKGEETYTFQEGDTVVFVFNIINNTSKMLSFSAPDIYLGEDFLKIQKLENNQFEVIGRAYTSIFCEYINALFVFPGINRYITSWPEIREIDNTGRGIFCGNKGKSPLKKGLYKTAFTSSFTYGNDEDIITSEMYFERYFTVE